MRLNWKFNTNPHGLASFESAGCFHWIEIDTRPSGFIAVIDSDGMKLAMKPAVSPSAARAKVEAVLASFDIQVEAIQQEAKTANQANLESLKLLYGKEEGEQ